MPPANWLEHIAYLESHLDTLPGQVHLEVLDAGQAWTLDPDGTTRRQLALSARAPSIRASIEPESLSGRATGVLVSERPLPAVPVTSADRWADVGCGIDPRLVAGGDWAGLAAALDRAQQAGYNVQENLPRLAQQRPLPDEWPARTLQYRLVQDCEAAITPLPLQVASPGIDGLAYTGAEAQPLTRLRGAPGRPR